VHSWASTPQQAGPEDLPSPGRDGRVLVDGTLRQTIRASAGGRWIRLSLSNAFGDTPLSVGPVAVAVPAAGRSGAVGVTPGTQRGVTFYGARSVRIPAGGRMVCDPVDFPVAPLTNLTVTVHLPDGLAADGVTGHPGSRTTSFVVTGDRVGELDLLGADPVEHWYLLDGLEVWSDRATRAAVMLGDSLTDGRGSTTNGNDRWPDRLLERLQTDAATDGVAVVNQAAGGNRVLNDGIGPSALSRIDHALSLRGVAWLVVFEGVNDIGSAPATEAAQKQLTSELIAAYDQIVRRAHSGGVRVYGATLTPFGGADYDDPAGLREATRRTVNDWIRTGNRFDAAIDFECAVRDPDRPQRLRPAYDTGDHLHLNPAGYQALADAVPTQLFRYLSPAPDFGFD
jgi:lysophospholipase L1-like esterase